MKRYDTDEWNKVHVPYPFNNTTVARHAYLAGLDVERTPTDAEIDRVIEYLMEMWESRQVADTLYDLFDNKAMLHVAGVDHTTDPTTQVKQMIDILTEPTTIAADDE